MIVKTCRRCATDKPASAFHANKRYRDGLSSWCAPCHRERGSEWAKENRAKLTKRAAAWRAENLEKARETNRRFKNANRDELAAAHAHWAAENKDKRRATSAKRKASKLRATPQWADHAAIAAIYKRASELQVSTGERLHVDHIVPLQHPLVCGLHVPANLQIIPGAENEAKKNYWWPDMFIERAPEPKQEALL